MHKIRIAEKLAEFSDYWSPKIVGQLNGQHVKLVKFHGDFVWHHHAAEDEMFLVLEGSFRMDYRDAAGREHSMDIDQGEFVIVPRGTEHRPSAESEVHVLLFEPAGTLNTGNVRHALTVDDPANLFSP
jgi:mannose-6-phosphate isomerase-like protein (cupin superfamily)